MSLVRTGKKQNINIKSRKFPFCKPPGIITKCVLKLKFD